MITNNNRQSAEIKAKKLGSEIEEWIGTRKNIEERNSTAENSQAKVFSSRCSPC